MKSSLLIIYFSECDVTLAKQWVLFEHCTWRWFNQTAKYKATGICIFSDDLFYLPFSSCELLLVQAAILNCRHSRWLFVMTAFFSSFPLWCCRPSCRCDTFESPSKTHGANNNIISRLYHGAMATRAFGILGALTIILCNHMIGCVWGGVAWGGAGLRQPLGRLAAQNKRYSKIERIPHWISNRKADIFDSIRVWDVLESRRQHRRLRSLSLSLSLSFPPSLSLSPGFSPSLLSLLLTPAWSGGAD